MTTNSPNPISQFMIMLALLTVAFIVPPAISQACPFCSAPQLTLSEQLSQSDVAVLTEWTGGTKPNFDAGVPGQTTYKILEIASANSSELKTGQEITLNDYYLGKPGMTTLVVGVKEASIEWLPPIEMSSTAFSYLKGAPSIEEDAAERLKYFLNHLESKDQLVADDAYAEFANAPYEIIVSIKEKFPREKLRKWVADPETAPTRLGLYGLMLGLCGDEQDEELLRKIIVVNDSDFRLGIDGIMGGYLVLAGEAGMDVLDEYKLKPAIQTQTTVPFSETFSAMQALKFYWQYEKGNISKDRLRASMRILLGHPDLADLVIIDLARWEDWSLIDRLIGIYDKEPYDIPAVKRAIIGYLIQCAKQKPTEEGATIPEFVTKAETHLKHLEEVDPKTMKTARLLYR